MPHRLPSPAASENEVDISHALANNGDSDLSDDGVKIQHPDRKARMLAQGEMPDLEGDYSSDDAGFIASTQADANRKAKNVKGKVKGGPWNAFGLSANLLTAISKKGYNLPTPIQRRTIPLLLDGKDVVGMARTGSGKTVSFILPLISRLLGHSAQVGARGLILSPSRELALQTLRVVKEFARGTDLRCVLLVGGDSLEENFSSMTANPDIIICTPGRFLHLKVEMGLDLSSMRYVVFDEADRLFELGFASQLTEILHSLPQNRQTALFSATLPKSLVEFARAGLQDPQLIRLDAESKVSSDLSSAFLSIKSGEKEGALLEILNFIGVPLGKPDSSVHSLEVGGNPNRKRKREDRRIKTTEHSTIVFCATKHHVDYLATLLRQAGYAVSHAYGSLDQTARRLQVEAFTTGMTNILVVTDVAARGIDLPLLANVINYDFPSQPKIFVHRVGRTARAGQRGWSYSLLRHQDAPYLLDLQLFLSRKLLFGKVDESEPNYAEDLVAGALVRDKVERQCEWVSKILDEDSELSALRSVAAKGEKLYLKTRNAASVESARRAKLVTGSKDWMALHPLFYQATDQAEAKRTDMLARVSGFRPQETVLELSKRGASGEGAEIMKKRRITVDNQRRKHQALQRSDADSGRDVEVEPSETATDKQPDEGSQVDDEFADSVSDDELEVTFSQPSKSSRTQRDGYKDSEFFMQYTPKSMSFAEERGYGVHSGGNFNSLAASATMDLNNDDGAKAFAEPSRPNGMRWDKKSKKYVARANDEDGSKGRKLVKGESGQKIAASFKSGRFDAWRKTNKVDRLPRTGEAENATTSVNRGEGRRFKHKSDKAPKDADKYRDDFYKRKKIVEKAREERRGRFKDGIGKSEIKGVDDVRKERGLKDKRREKNARPGKKR